MQPVFFFFSLISSWSILQHSINVQEPHHSEHAWLLLLLNMVVKHGSIVVLVSTILILTLMSETKGNLVLYAFVIDSPGSCIILHNWGWHTDLVPPLIHCGLHFSWLLLMLVGFWSVNSTSTQLLITQEIILIRISDRLSFSFRWQFGDQLLSVSVSSCQNVT